MKFPTINMEPQQGKGPFVRAIPRDGRVLDVGCGNGSPAWFRSTRPDLYYVGVDVGDYNQKGDPNEYANEYVICRPEDFAATLERYAGQMDAVVSSHNLEHCDDPDRVVAAMVSALNPGGSLFMAFPCEESVRFPKRGGCLNFFDDSSHQRVPSWKATLDSLALSGCRVEFQAKRYRPFPLWLKGLLMEPVSAARREVIPGGSTWALYGFESVIWARKE
jgi:SAM-dependent methyltransferase